MVVKIIEFAHGCAALGGISYAMASCAQGLCVWVGGTHRLKKPCSLSLPPSLFLSCLLARTHTISLSLSLARSRSRSLSFSLSLSLLFLSLSLSLYFSPLSHYPTFLSTVPARGPLPPKASLPRTARAAAPPRPVPVLARPRGGGTCRCPNLGRRKRHGLRMEAQRRLSAEQEHLPHPVPRCSPPRADALLRRGAAPVGLPAARWIFRPPCSWGAGTGSRRALTCRSCCTHHVPCTDRPCSGFRFQGSGLC